MNLKVSDGDVSSPWVLQEDLFQVSNVRLSETLFSQGNGLIGVRGTPEEGWHFTQKGKRFLSCEGVYLNGFYSQSPIPYGESAYAFATHNDQLLQVPNTKAVILNVLDEKQVVEHRRSLDMRTGLLHRKKVVETQQGDQCQLTFERFVSATHPHLVCLRVKATAVVGQINLNLIPALDDKYGAVSEPDDPRAGELSIVDTLTRTSHHASEGTSKTEYQVKGVNTHVNVTCLDTLTVGESVRATRIGEEAKCQLNQGESLTFTRYALFHAGDDPSAVELAQQAAASELTSIDYDTLKAEHVDALSAFWQQAELDVQLETGDVSLQQGLIFSMFQLYQSAGRNGKAAIAAKGLSGPGYDGHYFWDTEIYVIPFFAFTAPEIAKSLLLYRYHTLAQAQQRARQMSHEEGALFSWRTISGDECSAFFPASTAQYHINAAVAFAIRTYYRATGDKVFMRDYGMTLLVETAKLWPQLGHFNRDGDFCIDGVTGPDEYTAVVNNNFYTNYMAKQHLLFAVEMASELDAKALQALDIDAQTLSLWQQIADKLYLPFDESKQAHPQDDSFFQKKVWDLTRQPKDKMPLLLHYHPLVIYRHQVLKQADVILAMFLGDEDFSLAQKQGNLAYYEPLTTHDSTLSSCIHSILYAEVGNMEKASEYFGDSARMDLDNLHHNTEYGVHTACMAGAWSCVVYGFLGLRLRRDRLSLTPKLPAGWKQIKQTIQYQGSALDITLSQQELTVFRSGGAASLPIHIDCHIETVSHTLSLAPGESKTISLATRGVEVCQ